MFFPLIQLYWLVEGGDGAVYPGPDESGAPGIIKDSLVFSLPVSHNGRQQHHAAVCGIGQDVVHNLINTLLFEDLPTLRAVGYADFCE